MVLRPPGLWFLEGRKMARWDEASRALCVTTRAQLAVHLATHIPRSCTHLKGHGSVKGAIRTLQRDLPDAPFVARFDIASYYQSMRHDVILDQLRGAGACDENVAVIRDYLALPDTRNTGRGMVASGGLSPLLGGLYLAPLDHAMNRLKARGQLVHYVRYMDDVVLLAKSRWQLRRAITALQAVGGLVGKRVRLEDQRAPISLGPIVRAGFDEQVVTEQNWLRPDAQNASAEWAGKDRDRRGQAVNQRDTPEVQRFTVCRRQAATVEHTG